MTRVLFLFHFILACTMCNAQDQRSQFVQLLQAGDTAKQRELLAGWERSDPQDAELYTCYFNYYVAKAKQEVLSLTTDQPDGESLSFQDSTGRTAGYIGSAIFYDPRILELAFQKIDEGIKHHPDRLDMRFGKIHVIGLTKDWERFTDEIVGAIRYSARNGNEWKWTNNEMKEDGEAFFLSSLQGYQMTLYDTGDDDLLVNMRTIAEETLKHYPDHVASLSNLSITYLLTKEYDKGIDALLRAEKLDPTDAIVLSNIAQGYRLKGDKQSAIKYYKRTIAHADEDLKAFAQQQIEMLEE